ncbi:hypothetical protein [Kangiella sp. M94]
MRYLGIALLFLVLSGCWSQDEMLRIQKNGDITMAIIVMPDWEFTTKEEVDSKAARYEEEMRKAGWKLHKSTETLSNGEFNLHYVLSGNLHKVGAKTSFYEIVSRNSKEINIKFLTPRIDEERVYRKLYFDYSIANTATVFDKNKSLVQEVETVNEQNTYIITL